MCAWFKLYPSPDQLHEKPFRHVLEKIDKRLVSERPIPQPLQDQEFFTPNYKPPDRSQYILTIKSQIQQKHQKNTEELLQRHHQWISTEYSPYPNRMTTSKSLKRQRERAKMLEFRKVLDSQLLEKSAEIEKARKQDQAKSQNLVKADLDEFHQYKNKKKAKEELDKSILTNSWAQASKNSIDFNSVYQGSPGNSPKNEKFKGNYHVNPNLNTQKHAISKKIEAILELARNSRQVSAQITQYKSTNQIIKGGKKHFSQ